MEKLGTEDLRRIGSYRLLARLGAGGMGEVYLARSDRGRTVAVKVVRRGLAEHEEFRARFREEVAAARRVGGHWTAPVLDADTEAETPWVATGYVAGPTLQTVVDRDHGALPERSVRVLAAGLGYALRDIHAAGLVHRDLKPSNVLVTIDGPRVIDFGIVRALRTVTGGGLTSAGLTLTGAVLGSPYFMAPEQVRGDRVTPACDIFCLGAILSYAATGKVPFGTADSGAHALMYRIAQEEPDLTGVPEGIADLVRDCLRKDPAARPSLDTVLERTDATHLVTDGRARDPWLPTALVAQLGRHAVELLDTETPETTQALRVVSLAPDTAAPDTAAPDTAPKAPEAPAAVAAAVAPAGPAGPAAPQAPETPERPETPDTAEAPGTEAAEAAEAAPDGTAVAAPDGAAVAAPDGAAVAEGPEVSKAAQAASPVGVGTSWPPMGQPPTVVAGGQAAPPGPLPPQVGYGYPQHPAGPASQPPYSAGPYAGPGAAVPGAAPVMPYGWAPQPQAQYPPGSYGVPGVPGVPGPGVSGGPGAPGVPGHPVPGARQEHGRGRNAALLAVIALVVALVVGGGVYALTSAGNKDAPDVDQAAPSSSSTADGGLSESGESGQSADSGQSGAAEGSGAPTPSDSASSGAGQGSIPDGFLGTWSVSIENASGHNTRQLTIQQGKPGDTVLSLTADGPSGNGTYHCVFQADLAAAPEAGGPVRIGPSKVTAGDPTSCRPGEPTELTLLPDGRLRRVNTVSGETLTYSRG